MNVTISSPPYDGNIKEKEEKEKRRACSRTKAQCSHFNSLRNPF